MYCKNCGEIMNDAQEVCAKCGCKKGVGTNNCPKCGTATPAGTNVCTNCGMVLNNTTSNTKKSINPDDKLLLVLVCLLAGGLGIHNFALDETKKAIVKILLTLFCGLGFILALIDVVKLCKGTYVVDPDAFI